MIFTDDNSLAPKYEELGQLYTSNAAYNDQVTIAKVDATANDVPEEIAGFPTIKLYAAGSKDSPINYEGARTVEDLANFIKDNGKHGVDAYVAPAETEVNDETLAKQAPAATEKEGVVESIKSAASEAAEAVKTVVADTDDGDVHDEL